MIFALPSPYYPKKPPFPSIYRRFLLPAFSRRRLLPFHRKLPPGPLWKRQPSGRLSTLRGTSDGRLPVFCFKELSRWKRVRAYLPPAPGSVFASKWRMKGDSCKHLRLFSLSDMFLHFLPEDEIDFRRQLGWAFSFIRLSLGCIEADIFFLASLPFPLY